MSGERAEMIAVRSKPGLRSLEAHLLSDREHPAIGITRSMDTNDAVLPIEKVRAIVGRRARIYYLPGEFLLRRLQGTLGRALALQPGSVRIWWPGLNVRSDPADHPLVLMLDGEQEQDAIAEFARQFDLSRPHVRQEIKLIEDVRLLVEQQLSEAAAQSREAEQKLRDAKIERHQALTRAEEAEQRLKDAAGDTLAALGCEERLYALISREWIRTLPQSERGEHPLASHLLTPELVAVAERQSDISQERLAWVCATIASGYEPALGDLTPHPLLSAPGGAQMERDDGAKGWRCHLEGSQSTAPWLHYWKRLDGTIEFAGVSAEVSRRASRS